jgi:hypothetical protein
MDGRAGRESRSNNANQELLLGQVPKKSGRPKPPLFLTMPGLLGSADLKDHASAWNLYQRSIRRIDKTGITTGAAAGIPHWTIIDDIGTAVRPKPDIGRPVEPGSMGGADECLIAAVVTSKILERDRQRSVSVFIEVPLRRATPTTPSAVVDLGA